MPVDVAPEVDRYALKGMLGRGGMGSVFRATDLHTGREIALKRLHPVGDGALNSRCVELFHQEFRTLAQLTHPNIVAVHDFGTDHDGPYYAMELIEGDDLHALSPLPWEQACALIRDVCSALSLLHSRRLVHRDLSPRNLRRTLDGRVKLLDFGGMVQMGPSRTVVGTPPLVPPEALLQQPLDARADLFAIGATLYFLLVRKHAYPARTIAQLSSAWGTRPLPPSSLVPGIPTELDRLVLGLLNFEPASRPASAAEVFDRLTALADLPRDDRRAVPAAYLSTPKLVAREHQLTRIRERLSTLRAGERGVFAIVGAAGLGRSRMLDHCVLEAKLSGMFVVRADAADAALGRYGVLGALARQLFGPGCAERAERHETLALLFSEAITAEVDGAKRPELQRAFSEGLAASSQHRPLVVVVDDLESCDEPSLAALAVAAADLPDNVLLAVSCLPDAHTDERGSVALLLQHALEVTLLPLAVKDTQELLASIFGDGPQLHTLTARIHGCAEGNPRGCVELSQYLLDHGLVRHEMGRWILPSSLVDTELPSTLSVARRERLASLSADAQEVGEALSVAKSGGLDLEAFVELTAHGDRHRLHHALDELLVAQILRYDNGGYVFESMHLKQELEAGLTPLARRRVSARLADALERRGRDRLEIAGYRYHAGQRDVAVDLLLEELAQGSRWDHAPPEYGQLLHGALNAAGELKRPRRDRMILRRELIKISQDLGSPDLRHHTLALLAELRRDSGLDATMQVPMPNDPVAQLQALLARVEQQHEATSELERGFAPVEAIIALGTLASETAAIAARTSDLALLQVIPRLEPFYPLSSSLKQIDEVTVPACRAIIAGDHIEARGLYEGQLATLLDPTRREVPEDLRQWGIRALHYAIGNIDASLGRKQALVHAAEIEKIRGWNVPAHSIRQVYHLAIGDLPGADEYRRRIELARLQSPVKPPFAAAAVFQHLFVFSMSDNPNGLRDAIPELEALASSLPGIDPFVQYARAEHARICGNYEEALGWVEQARKRVSLGDHPIWPWLVSSWLNVLISQGRFEDARRTGMREIARWERQGELRGYMDVPLALAEASLGDFESACRRLDRVIEKQQNEGVCGAAVSMVHDVRARVALRMNDAKGFERHARVCAEQVAVSKGNPGLTAKHQRLVTDAHEHGIVISAELGEGRRIQVMVNDARCDAREHPSRIIKRALAACSTQQERLQRALEILVERANARQAELFVVDGDGLVRAAHTTDGLSDQGLPTALSCMLEARGSVNGAERTATLAIFEPVMLDGTPAQRWPLPLVDHDRGETTVVGVAVLYFDASTPVRLPRELGRAIAGILADDSDVATQVTGLPSGPGD